MSYPMNIGEAAQAAGVTAKMIPHYESLGLIAPASRTDDGYRQYVERDVTVLRFIRQSRSMGFSIRQIEQLLSLWADTRRESRAVKTKAREHIAELDRKMAEMAQMRNALEQIAAGCDGDDRADCPILMQLSGDRTDHRPARPEPGSVARRNRTPGRAGAARLPEWGDHAGLMDWTRRALVSAG